jgi:hypothetical protein
MFLAGPDIPSDPHCLSRWIGRGLSGLAASGPGPPKRN